MFGVFIHPRPVGRTREVAELSVRVTARARIDAGHVLQASREAPDSPRIDGMTPKRFNVFGRILELRREGDAWRALSVGNDGKLAPAGFEIPSFIEDAEMEQFLYDMFHESATPSNGEVRRVGG